MKFFKSWSQSSKSKGHSSTSSIQSMTTAGWDDSSSSAGAFLSSSHLSSLTESTTAATTDSTANAKRRFHPLRRKNDGEDRRIAEARARTARMLEPPAFRESQFARLRELKAAKATAEERAKARGEGRAGSGGDCGSSVISGVSCETLSLDEEQKRVVRRDAAVFLSSLLVHMALLPLRKYSVLPLILVALQSLSLCGLLNFVLVYAFDRIDFGQVELVKNMDHAKRLFVEEVRKYSQIISVSVAAVSCSYAVGRGVVLWSADRTCRLLERLWEESPNICGYEAAAMEAWGVRTFNVSSFIALRLGVFVVSLLFLGHLLLPKRNRGKDVNNDADGKSSGGPSPRASKKRGALAFSVSSFLLAAMTASINASTASASSPLSSHTQSQKAIKSILVAGSLNADTFLPIHRFPSSGENLTLLPNRQPLVDVPGGKGCNQAIACAKLSSGNVKAGKVAFLGQFGNDAAAQILRSALVDNDVDISACGHSKLYPSGRGYVMIVPNTGEVSAVVSGGSNLYGWRSWGVVNDDGDGDEQSLTEEQIGDLVSSHSLLLLQCEVPRLVNLRLARAARESNMPVIVDVGGEDRRMEPELLECCDYLVPNETELDRLAKSYQDGVDDRKADDHGMTKQQVQELQAKIGPTIHLPSILKSVATLQANGSSNVLVTLGSRGSLLVKKKPAFGSHCPSILYQPSCTLPSGSTVVDETGAGDCYRAGFAVTLLERCKDSIMDDGGDVDDAILLECMRFASAAGALAVTRQGAVPSIPSREEVEELLIAEAEAGTSATSATLKAVPRGGSDDDDEDADFPFVFGSRINSMKDRLDLVDLSSLPMSTPRDYLRRQATIRGLGCVDFNYPQHFGDHWTPKEAKAALDEVKLVAGAVCLRYPSKFARGAMNHPDEEMRREAIEITKQAAETARILGCNEVVVWSAYDGYDYPFQVNYKEKWDQIVSAFQECCDAYPDIKWSLEFKPTDENTRFFTVPSTGAAMLLVKEVNRPNMGLTLDMGHMLMAGENPGQSIAMVGEKLFGIQLNDGYTRLAAEDGMMFGSIHPSIALEAMYQLHQIDFKGHLYFDTFPQRSDPVKEAEHNIRRVKEFWRAAEEILNGKEAEKIAREHDAIGALELVDGALRRR